MTKERGIFLPKTSNIAKETDPYDVLEIEALESLIRIQNACDDLKRLCRRTRSDEGIEQAYLKIRGHDSALSSSRADLLEIFFLEKIKVFKYNINNKGRGFVSRSQEA